MSKEGSRTPEPQIQRPGQQSRTPLMHGSLGRRSISGRGARAVGRQADLDPRVGRKQSDHHPAALLSSGNSPTAAENTGDFVVVEKAHDAANFVGTPVKSKPWGRGRGRGRGFARDLGPETTIRSPFSPGNSSSEPVSMLKDQYSPSTASWVGTQQQLNAPSAQVPIYGQSPHQNTEVIIEVSSDVGPVDKLELELHFEDLESGSEPKAIKDCIVSPQGIGYVTFHNFDAAERVLTKSHQLGKVQLHLRQVSEIPETEEQAITIQLKNIPPDVDKLYIELCVNNIPQVSVGDIKNGSCSINLPALHSQELEKAVSNLERLAKSKNITILKCSPQNTLYIKNITTSRGVDIIRKYFTNAGRSGGGEMIGDPTVLKDGTVLVTFKDSEVLKRVLSHNHAKLFGEGVQLDTEEHHEHDQQQTEPEPAEPAELQLAAPKPLLNLNPLQVDIDSSIAQAIFKCSAKLKSFEKKEHISSKVERDHILFMPSDRSSFDWQQKCHDFVATTFAKSELEVKNELDKDFREKCASLRQGHAFISDVVYHLDKSIRYTLAGETEVLTELHNYKEKMETNTEERIDLQSEHYDFIVDKLDLFKGKYPSLKITCGTSKGCSITLKGPFVYVDQLKHTLEELANDLQIIPVELDKKVINHFATVEGRAQINDYIRKKQCPVVVSFNVSEPFQGTSRESKINLSFVCEASNSTWANSVSKDLQRDAIFIEIIVPEKLQSIDRMDDYKALITQLKRDYHARIFYDAFEKQISIYGLFSENMNACETNIHAFIEGKEAQAIPLQYPVSQSLFRALKQRPQSLEHVLTSCNPSLTCSFSDSDETHLLVTSKTYTTNDWKSSCRAALQNYIGKFSPIEVSFVTDAKQEIHELLAAKEQSSESPFYFEIEEGDGSLVEIAGETAAVSGLEHEIEKISNAYTRKKKQYPLLPAQRKYIVDVMLETMRTKHPKLTIDISTDGHKLEVVGPQVHLNDFDECYANYSSVTPIPIEIDVLLINFLSINDNGKKFLQNFLNSKGGLSIAVYSSSSNHLSFLCDTSIKKSVEAVVKELKSQLVTGRIVLPESLKKPRPDAKARLAEFYQKLEKENNVVCAFANSKTEIMFGGLPNNVQEAVKKMTDFIHKECTVTKELQLTSPQWRLIQKDERWIRDIKQWSCDVTPIKKDSQVTEFIVQLKGDEFQVNQAYENLQEMRVSLKTDSIKVIAPGACQFFRSETTTLTILPGIENSYKVCIETVDLDPESEVIHDVNKSPSATEYCRVTTKFEENNNNIVTFKVHIGDLTEFVADVIVNPANGNLRHSGGLAAAIIKKGGPEIQQDCDQFVKGNLFELEEGEVYFSRIVGKLPCKAIVHAVGPRWRALSKTHDYEKTRLSQAIVNSLRKAKKLNSIAFPAISSGIFKYPLDKCALVHIETSVGYFKSASTSLSEVSFVVIDSIHAAAFHKALSQVFPNGVITLDIEASMVVVPRPVSNPSSALKASPSSKASGEIQSMGFPASKMPQLHQGDLFNAKVTPDVYVCTANTSLDLSRGIIAQRMLKLAGSNLQKECTDKGRAKVGDVVVTGPGKLKCQYIFHAVAANYSNDSNGKVLQELIQKCLKECERQKVNSIAFPAIGPGGLGYPAKLVANIMITESCKYLSKTKNNSFQIHLIIFDSDQHKIFSDELQSIPSHADKPRMSITSLSKSIKAAATSISAVRNTVLNPEFAVQGLQVSVVKGDITKESSDAIVNTTSSGINLSSSGQVSKILLKIAGPELQKFCTEAVDKEGQLTEGKVIATKALKPLKCKTILHIYFNSNDSMKYVETIKACLLKAEQLQCTTIALPAIGTGAQNYPTTEAAKGTITGIKQFALTSPKFLKQIRIVIFNESIYDSFLCSCSQPANEHVASDTDTDEEGSVSSYTGSQSEEYEDEEYENEPADTIGHVQSPSTFSFLSSEMEGSSVDDEDSVQEQQKGLKLLICGFDEKGVNGAVQRLQILMRENFDKEEINNESIRNLSQKECQQIVKECKKSGVECRIETDIGRIQLTGNVNHITKIRAKVSDIILGVMSRKNEEDHREMQHQYEVETLHYAVRWQYKEDSTFSDYDKEISFEIERAFQLFDKDRQKNNIFKYQKEPYNFTIDFKKREERDYKTKKNRRIRRFTDKETGVTPDTWDDMPADCKVHCVDLKPDDAEYKQVLDIFNKTMTKGTTYNGIVKIQRVQNPKQYLLYSQAKQVMDKANPPGHPNERQLFHGTDADSAIKIYTNGFDRIYAGRNATAYGKGTYFARDASYSCSPTYSKPDINGHKYIYLTRVLVGEYTVGRSSMMVPPAKDPSKDPNVLFDSLVNRISDPTIFVVGPDAHSYPEYLIIFK